MEAIYQQLDEQARAALKEREGQTKRLSEERRLRRVRRELEEAQLVADMLKGDQSGPVVKQSSRESQRPIEHALQLTPLLPTNINLPKHTPPPLSLPSKKPPLPTPSPLRPLPTTGPQLGRPSRQVMIHDESY